MIYGIGNDLVALKRIENLYQKYGQNLANHVLHPIEQEELVQANNQANFIAKRFAAKEAFAKAVGTGLHSPVTLRNIGVGHHESGKPEFFYEPVLQRWLVQQGVRHVHLSLSDEGEHVLAFAVAER